MNLKTFSDFMMVFTDQIADKGLQEKLRDALYKMQELIEGLKVLCESSEPPTPESNT
jgi:hypothetical protein